MEFCREGQLLGGKYRLIRRLGRGGMGSVWHAQHLALNAPVALKFIDAAQLDAEALQRFLGEARMAAALRSPHVVQILDYGVEEDTPHIAMELLEGETLAERLARLGRLSLAETALVVQHVGRALGRAHDAGIVHRDLKPENVFIVSNDDEELVKVLDFGIAKGNPATLGDSAAIATRTGALLGTLYYMSPEQVDGGKALDHRADIWALGVLAYKCLVGQLPFAGDSVGRVVLAICSRPLPVPSEALEVPPGFDAWFARACAREPAERFESVREAAREFLERCAGAAPREGDAAPDSRELDARAPDSQAAAALAAPAFGATTGDATNAEVAAESLRQRRPSRLRLVSLAVASALLALVLWRLAARARPEPVATPRDPAPQLQTPPAKPAAAGSPGESSPGLALPEAPVPVPVPAPVPTPAPMPVPAQQSTPPESPVSPPPRPADRRRSTPARPSSAAPAQPAPTQPVPTQPAAAPDRIPSIPTADMDLGI